MAPPESVDATPSRRQSARHRSSGCTYSVLACDKLTTIVKWPSLAGRKGESKEIRQPLFTPSGGHHLTPAGPSDSSVSQRAASASAPGQTSHSLRWPVACGAPCLVVCLYLLVNRPVSLLLSLRRLLVCAASREGETEMLRASRFDQRLSHPFCTSSNGSRLSRMETPTTLRAHRYLIRAGYLRNAR